MKEVIDRNTDLVNKLLLAGTVPVNKQFKDDATMVLHKLYN